MAAILLVAHAPLATAAAGRGAPCLRRVQPPAVAARGRRRRQPASTTRRRRSAAALRRPG
ncbi:MAG: hypothetical protein MZW92_27840 [Comamonadaceae bacterium]|nr:hypothetical protein [Comamonadaceae bacterium]